MQSGITDKVESRVRLRSAQLTHGKVRRPGREPECCSVFALLALQRGEALGRPMTSQERIALAVSSTRPSHHLMVPTRGDSRRQLVSAFHRLVRRVQVRKERPRLQPLIYVGAIADRTGEGGSHMHLLLWERPYASTYQVQAREVGLGSPHAEWISPQTPANVLKTVCYALGQQESVFGTGVHLANRPREPYEHCVLHPQLATLKEHRPELFVALTLAKDESVSDKDLFDGLPRFIREDSTCRELYGKGDLEAELNAVGTKA
jgi:hypothetical protein